MIVIGAHIGDAASDKKDRKEKRQQDPEGSPGDAHNHRSLKKLFSVNDGVEISALESLIDWFTRPLRQSKKRKIAASRAPRSHKKLAMDRLWRIVVQSLKNGRPPAVNRETLLRQVRDRGRRPVSVH
jgi:hypothetical protein